MSEAVITALIVAGSSIICQILINVGNRRKQSKDDADKEKKRAVEQAIKDERLENRLRNIEKELVIHNGYADKLGEIQKDLAVIKNDIKTLYKQA